MTLEERFENALRSPEPGQALRSLVLQLSSEGNSKEQIYGFFERFLLRLREKENHRESDQDVLMDVMDALVGWCHPDARLLPGQ